MDTKVLMTQQWLNETYAGTSGYSAVDEDGITGMGTIRALIWALQTEHGHFCGWCVCAGTAKAFTSPEYRKRFQHYNHQSSDSYSAGCIVLQGAGSRSHLS